MSILDQIYEKAKQNPQRVAFPEAENEKMMRAAYETGKDGYIIPILVGDAQKLQALSEERGYDSSVFCTPDAGSALLCDGHAGSGRGGSYICRD